MEKINTGLNGYEEFDINNLIKIEYIFDDIRRLLNQNIIEITFIKQICYIVNNCNLNNRPILEEAFYRKLKVVLRDCIDSYSKQFNNFNYATTMNHCIFFMIMLLNIQGNKNLITKIFSDESEIIEILLEILKLTKNAKSNRIKKILCHIFFDEYYNIFFDHGLEDLYILNNCKFSQENTEGLDKYSRVYYVNILNSLVNINVTYEYLSNNKVLPEGEEKALTKIIFIQSIIRIVFSREKYNYLNENDKNDYEIFFLKNIVNNCCLLTKENFGDNYKCLFRKDEIYDDIIKYVFFMFGNKALVKSYLKPLKKFIQYESKSQIKKEDFMKFFESFLQKIKIHTPFIIRVILKTINEGVQGTFKIEKDNISPIYTCYIFNFIMSPRMTDYYDISPSKYSVIRNLNRLIKNILFNVKFDENDELNTFNDIVADCNIRLNSIFYELISFELKEFENVPLTELLFDYNIVFPKFLFYFDCSCVSSILKFDPTTNIRQLIKLESISI